MQNSQTPKNFFLQTGIFVSLYASAISFLIFLFSIIDEAFPNAIYYYNDSSSGIRFSISTIIIVFPIFVWLARVYRKFTDTNPEIKESKLRKWIIYITIFITGATIAVDMIVLVNAFLGGEGLTTNFILKILSVLIVSGGIFTFCIKDLKGYFDDGSNKSKIWLFVVSTILIISVVGGFVIIGSPSKQRDIKLDEQRIGDLNNLQYQIVNYYQQKGVLPTYLEQVNDPLSGFIIPKDPETKASYVFSTTGKLSFKICADFKTEFKVGNATDNNVYMNDSMYIPLSVNENWQHGVGNTCFERTIDPDKYPLYNSK